MCKRCKRPPCSLYSNVGMVPSMDTTNCFPAVSSMTDSAMAHDLEEAGYADRLSDRPDGYSALNRGSSAFCQARPHLSPVQRTIPVESIGQTPELPGLLDIMRHG